MSYEENITETCAQLDTQLGDAVTGLKLTLLEKPEGEKLVGMISAVFGIDEDGKSVIIAVRTRCSGMENAPVPMLLALEAVMREHLQESLHTPH